VHGNEGMMKEAKNKFPKLMLLKTPLLFYLPEVHLMHLHVADGGKSITSAI
jgi:hypothetical protein